MITKGQRVSWYDSEGKRFTGNVMSDEINFCVIVAVDVGEGIYSPIKQVVCVNVGHLLAY